MSEETASPIKKLVTLMAKALVDQEDAVDVREIEGEQTTIAELRVDKSDLGKVIGKHGHTAQALRTIVSAASRKLRKRTILEIIE